MNLLELKTVARIKELRLSGSPADKIIRRPGHELWNYANNPAQLAVAICQNVHWYGRNGNPAWTWLTNNNGNPTGEALARGTLASTNCGGFNTTARWIGIEVFGLSDTNFKGSYTDASDCFITRAGTQAIDRNWSGNVRTLTQNFAALRAYFFKSHSYNSYGANLLDASTNTMNFNSKTDLYWCELLACNQANSYQDGRAFMVKQRYAATVIPGNKPYACVSTVALKKFIHLFPGFGGGTTSAFINTLPDTTGGGGWPTFLLVSRDDLPSAFRSQMHL